MRLEGKEESGPMLSANASCCHPDVLLFVMPPCWYFSPSPRARPRCMPCTEGERCRKETADAVLARQTMSRKASWTSPRRHLLRVTSRWSPPVVPEVTLTSAALAPATFAPLWKIKPFYGSRVLKFGSCRGPSI
ncbi:hypothetical protein Y1Q_0009317 [Alligator mississippiensis]|uniref:Uncharacterized protein n=1 Tax=Alligator mississippiensis TaxID=8496 RepID=A0A151N7A1_ALLMI|nr:hypothetical protein Y1Q_0009317 [Alligator mississippiensis]